MIPNWIRHLFEYSLIKNSGLFDGRYYLKQYQDCRRADVDPLMHYVTVGWKEGKNPSAVFNTQDYIEMSADVQKAGLNPLVHYIRYGRKEGRVTSLASQQALGINIVEGNRFPKVSVIVPNYNHAAYLRERLDSIYQQTYHNIEVILLDDCSTDGSPQILNEYQARHPENTRCVFNETNSGSPFSQWKKGISLAEGELIWIAESDDACEKDFLEKLVPYFADDTILLGYGHSRFVNESGEPLPFTFEQYLTQLDPHRWDASYIQTAHKEVNTSLGYLNTIPNVSSVVFRKYAGEFPLFQDTEWLKMKVCGDWVFYLHLMRAGRVAYCREAHNLYRIHQTSSSKLTHTQEVYYREHQKVAETICSLYQVPESLIQRLHQRVKEFYFLNVKDGSEQHFVSLFSLDAMPQWKERRIPNVMVATVGFSFGGGEIFPVRLANALKDQGAAVILFNGAFEPMQLGVRRMLYPQVPVFHYNQSLSLKTFLEDFGIEIIHTHHALMEKIFSAVRAKEKLSVKQVATMHGMYELMDDFKEEARAIHKGMDHWFYTAEKNVAPFKKMGWFSPEKFTKIDNGMAIPRFQKLDLSSLGITPASICACLASRALPEKGWLEAIEAINKARQMTGKDIHLLLIGEGPVYASLQQQAVPGYIHLLGYRANLDDYIASSQVGLLPSYFKGESFPLVLIEFFMVGVPVIASRIGEIPTMMAVDEQRLGGLMIGLPNGKVDPDELAQALVRLITDPVLYQESLAAVEILKKRFNIENVAKKYIGSYQKILAGQPEKNH